MVTLGELAAHLDLALESVDTSIQLEAIAPIERAGPRDLAFVAEARYLDALQKTRAGCVLVREEWKSHSPVPVLCVDNPYLAYARVSGMFDTHSMPAPGVHPTAVVAPSVAVPDDVFIGPLACVEDGVVLGSGVTIGAGAYIGRGVSLGEGTCIHPGVVLYHQVSLGRACRVHAGTVIGADGFGFARTPVGWERINQLGSVRIGNFVDIGAGATIDRGAIDDTIIHDHVIIDDQVHIAHNCEIGERTAIAGCVGMAGSATIGADCTFAGQVGVSGHIDICDNAHFTGQARVARSVDEPGNYASGTPLESQRRWARNAVRFSQLDSLQKRVKDLESQLQAVLDSVSSESGSVSRPVNAATELAVKPEEFDTQKKPD
ncbi:MAG: UDP-3-O-(3-hydroxymyristoyl)glucosamine N-acyltransferase [Congregibacter sp.]